MCRFNSSIKCSVLTKNIGHNFSSLFCTTSSLNILLLCIVIKIFQKLLFHFKINGDNSMMVTTIYNILSEIITSNEISAFYTVKLKLQLEINSKVYQFFGMLVSLWI